MFANVCLCFSLRLLSHVPEDKPWVRDPEIPDPSRSVLLDLNIMCDWRCPSVMEPEFGAPEHSLDDNMLIQCLHVA